MNPILATSPYITDDVRIIEHLCHDKAVFPFQLGFKRCYFNWQGNMLS